VAFIPDFRGAALTWRRSTVFSCHSTKSPASSDTSPRASTVGQLSRQRTTRLTAEKITQG